MSLLFAFLMLFTQAFASVHVLELNGSVNPGSAHYLINGIKQAEIENADAVLIMLDTPGGLMTSSREIVQAELNSTVPIIVYVGPSGARAGSAGVFITLASHVAVMAPGTTIGAAHPVSITGSGIGGKKEEGQEQAQDNVMEEKILQDTLAWVRAIANTRGRNVDWAQRSVELSEAITDQEAVELGVVDFIAEDLEILLKNIHGMSVETANGSTIINVENAELVKIEMNKRQFLIHLLGDPNLIYVLLGIGLLGLYVEYHHPGLIIPGVLGALLLIVVAVGLSILPFSLAGLILILAGFGLFALEIWVPSYGALTLGGIAALALGGILLFDVQDLDLRVSTSTIIAVSFFAAFITTIVAFFVIKSHKKQVITGREGIIGEQATVIIGGFGSGKIKLQGEIWQADWSGELPAGTKVRILKIRGLTILVEAIKEKE